MRLAASTKTKKFLLSSRRGLLFVGIVTLLGLEVVKIVFFVARVAKAGTLLFLDDN